MQVKSRRLLTISIFIAAFFSIMQFSTPNIIGFDGYWHIKMADIIRNDGLVYEFPWARETILADDFADVHLLFHLMLVPFTLFGLMLGAKIAAVLMASACFIVFYWFLEKHNIKYPAFWTAAYLFSSVSLTYRFMLPRQMPLAVALILLSVYFIENKKYAYLGILSMVFAWLYSGFVIGLFAVLAYFTIDLFFSKKLKWKILAYPFGGAAVALIANPYFPGNISFLYDQIVRVNLAANLYNAEWKPWTILEFLKNSFVPIIFIFSSFFIIFKNKKINSVKLFYLLMSLFFLAYTFRTKRMYEYLVPFSVLCAAFFYNDYIENAQSKNKFKYIKNLKYAAVIGIAVLAALSTYGTFSLIKNSDFLNDFDGCSGWMRDNVQKGAVVFINAYAFPYLFLKNSDLIYTHGLDLTYSYLHDREKFEKYMGILKGTIRTNVDWIQEDYAPDYVFSGKQEQDVQLFNYIIANKKKYKAAYEDRNCAVLEAV